MLRQNQDDRRLTNTLAIAAIILFLSTLFLFINDSWISKWFANSGQGESVAIVSRHDNDVRRRASGGIAWYELSDSDKIYQDDLVFSGVGSQVSVEMKTGNKLEIGENTLVSFSLGKVSKRFRCISRMCKVSEKNGADL